MNTTPLAQVTVTESSRDVLQGIYLQRLERLLRLRQEHEQDLNRHGLRLLDHSIFAAYCDCRQVGVGQAAREHLREAKFTLEQPGGQLDVPGPRTSPGAAALDSRAGATPES